MLSDWQRLVTFCRLLFFVFERIPALEINPASSSTVSITIWIAAWDRLSANEVFLPYWRTLTIAYQHSGFLSCNDSSNRHDYLRISSVKAITSKVRATSWGTKCTGWSKGSLEGDYCEYGYNPIGGKKPGDTNRKCC